MNPGESADVSVILTSSSATGNLTGTWKLSNDKGQTFGDSLTVVVNSGTATTATPTTTVVATTTAIPSTATTAPVTATAVPTTSTPPTETPVTPIQ